MKRKVTLPEQLIQLVHFHEGLSVKNNDEGWVISGTLSFECDVKERIIREAYDVEISVTSKFPYVLPAVREIGGRIPKIADNHVYTDTGFLCLGTEVACISKAIKSRNLLAFVNEQLIPFLGGYSYFRRYGGGWPYGELSHGCEGVVEYYRDYFGVDDDDLIPLLIHMALRWNDKSWKKSMSCICKSGKKYGVCHYESVRQLSKPTLKKALEIDFQLCTKYLEKTPALNSIGMATNKIIPQNERIL